MPFALASSSALIPFALAILNMVWPGLTVTDPMAVWAAVLPFCQDGLVALVFAPFKAVDETGSLDLSGNEAVLLTGG